MKLSINRDVSTFILHRFTLVYHYEINRIKKNCSIVKLINKESE